MKYLIIGDVHGYWSDLAVHLRNVNERGIDFDEVIQVGDFGVYIGKLKLLKQMLYKLKFDKPIHFIDGNHEDHPYLYQSMAKLAKMNVFYHPRCTITFLEDGTKIGWMGGAFNVDRPQYAYPDGTSNFPHPKEIGIMADVIKKNGGVDLMVTHSCPMGIGIGIHGHPIFQESAINFIGGIGYRPAPMLDVGDEPHKDLWEMLEGYRPKTWVFGHLHRDVHSKVGTTDFWCVGHCGSAGIQRMPRIYIYDTDSKEIMG